MPMGGILFWESYFHRIQHHYPPLIMNNALEPARPGVRIPDVRFFRYR